ncbi:DUF222 domain-containing protein [Streptacidiphilus sp. EB129]|uniref:HNH endonuclease signature motif containing protein n=1 Tax=Streptacidiphilus sp. EB129 TaxID=3156262 RepID=UPI0035111AC1
MGLPQDADGARHVTGTPWSSRQARFTDPLRTLPSAVHTLLDALTSQDEQQLHASGARELAEQVLALQRLGEMLAAEQLRRLAVFDRTGGPCAVRCRSTKGFLRTHAQLAHARAGQMVTLARELDRLPQVREAQARGELSYDQAQILAHELAPIEDDTAREQAQALMLEQTPKLHLAHVRQAAKQIHAHLVTDAQPAQREAPAAFQSWVKLSPTGTSDDPFWVLSGELSPLAGERLRVALEAATAAPADGDPRSHAQRMGDALATVADLALRSDALPTTGGQRPQLTLIADLDAFRPECPTHPTLNDTLDGVQARNVTGDVVGTDHGSGNGLAGLLRPRASADTTRGYRLTAWQLRKEACDCRLRVILTRGQDRPVSIGRATRTVPGHLRDAVVARDRHCVWPGCTRPPTWCEAHHLVHWADGGDTSLDNLALLCGEHHTDLHQTGWELQMRNGTPHAVPPPDMSPPLNTRYPPLTPLSAAA